MLCHQEQQHRIFGWYLFLNKGSSLNAPAPAAAAGYTVQTFGPGITLGTTPDPTTSYPQFTNGANWVPFAFLGTEWTNIGVVQNSDGSITLNGAGEIYGNGVTTAVPPGSAGNTSWQGIAFGGGGYFEATMAFNGPASFWANDFESMGYSSAGDLTERQWPGQAAGYGDWIETDFAEFDTTNAYGFAMHNWYGTPDNPQAPVPGSGSTVTPGGPLGPPAGTDYTQPHKYGFLWVPATATTQGYAQWYFDDAQVGNTITWNQYDPTLPPPPTDFGTGGGSAYSVLDTRHLALILGANPGVTDTISAVSVWQGLTADDIGTLAGSCSSSGSWGLT